MESRTLHGKAVFSSIIELTSLIIVFSFILSSSKSFFCISFTTTGLWFYMMGLFLILIYRSVNVAAGGIGVIYSFKFALASDINQGIITSIFGITPFVTAVLFYCKSCYAKCVIALSNYRHSPVQRDSQSVTGNSKKSSLDHRNGFHDCLYHSHRIWS